MGQPEGGDSSVMDANYPPTNRWPEAPLGRGGGLGRAMGGGLGGFCRGGGGVREGWLGGGGDPGGAICRVHAPKAKRWSITGSPYLPLPSI